MWTSPTESPYEWWPARPRARIAWSHSRRSSRSSLRRSAPVDNLAPSWTSPTRWAVGPAARARRFRSWWKNEGDFGGARRRRSSRGRGSGRQGPPTRRSRPRPARCPTGSRTQPMGLVLPPDVRDLPNLRVEPWLALESGESSVLEGPAFARDGSLYVTSVAAGRIYCIPPNGDREVIFEDP